MMKATRTALSREKCPGYRLDMLWVDAPGAGAPVQSYSGQDRTKQRQYRLDEELLVAVPVRETDYWAAM
jgi:hypothetical protein